ncbi:Hypothetical_protein [Hexamita inflata]|uniref:Hypothetical_protein n=1 Tax=Hexamita inflata TaxID=28002 RepID=A0AA86PM33_9EUKA|nr:Hypothetical protein HINF_LOCUS28723 [Hexamita inflata]
MVLQIKQSCAEQIQYLETSISESLSIEGNLLMNLKQFNIKEIPPLKTQYLIEGENGPEIRELRQKLQTSIGCSPEHPMTYLRKIAEIITETQKKEYNMIRLDSQAQFYTE